MATITNSERMLGTLPRLPSAPVRERMSEPLDPRFVIQATRFHRGTAEDRVAVVGDLLSSTRPLPRVARMAAFLAGYCGAETAVAFCEVVEDLQQTAGDSNGAE